MINFDGKEMQGEFNRVFADLITLKQPNDTPDIKTPLTIENLTLEQLWWLVKFAKHVRGRCRSNAAFNNYMNRNFAPAQFKEVPKEYNGKHYMGLQIKVGENISEGEE